MHLPDLKELTEPGANILPPGSPPQGMTLDRQTTASSATEYEHRPSTENSGHYGTNWNDAVRSQFSQWLSDRLGLPVVHKTWNGGF